MGLFVTFGTKDAHANCLFLLANSMNVHFQDGAK